jgi:hypothetical protein
MRNYILFIVLLFFSFGSEAITDPINNDKNCRLDSVEYQSHLDYQERILEDLVSNDWILSESTTFAGMTQHFDFNEIGIVKITTSFSDPSIPTSSKNMVWQLTFENNKSLLILTDINTHSYSTYKLNETCKGFSLNNVLLNKQVELNLIAGK